MSRIVFKAFKGAAVGMLLTGCGLTQTVSDSATSTAQAIFYPPITTLHLDVSGRAALNLDAQDTSTLSVPTVVRVYQLQSNKTMATASYDQVLNHAERLLGTDLLDERALVIKPGDGAQLSVPLHKGTRYVTVVALLRNPEHQPDGWRLTLVRKDLESERARLITLGDNRLALQPQVKE